MSCTKVLHAFNGHPKPSVTSADLAMHLCLSQGQSLYQMLAMKPRNPICQSTDYPPKRSPDSPPHSLSSSSSPSSSPGFSQPRSCIRKKSGKWQNKKHVMFADAKGLALTTLHLFIPEPSPPPATMVLNPIQPKLQCQQSPSMKTQRYKLRLGFPQPTLDIKAFLARLQETQIQLESCSVSEYSLSGKVCICSTSIENTVHLRMTYDSWRNYHDIPCTYLQQHCRGLNMDVFAFDVALPHNLKPNDRVEFCVFSRPSASGIPLWDTNRGQHYRLCIETDRPSNSQASATNRSPSQMIHRPSSWPLNASLNVKNSASLSSDKFVKQSWG